MEYLRLQIDDITGRPTLVVRDTLALFSLKNVFLDDNAYFESIRC